MRRVLVLSFVLVFAAGALAQISTPGCSLSGNGTSTSTSTALNCTPHANGNTIIIFLDLATAGCTSSNCVANPPACTDGTTSLTPSSSVVVANSRSLLGYNLASANTGHTAFGCSWANSASYTSMITEYAGNTGGLNTNITAASTTGVCTNAGCTVNNATIDLSATIDDANDWLVCGFAATNAITVTVGTQRVNQGASPRSALLDNTAASITSVDCRATETASVWRALGIELRLSAVHSSTTIPNTTLIPHMTVF